ncbi:MAG: hypothetical protein FJX57_16880 [Alphaproteobacteria bacterium]|nr:hypothetical protein [Alphaproteobacteria bacterium]
MTAAASSPALPTTASHVGNPTLRAAMAIVALLLIVWLPVHLSLPLGRDHAIIGRVSLAILDGYWPYADAWDHKGPVTYLLYLPAFLLFGRHEHAILWFDVLMLCVVAQIGARFGSRRMIRGLGPLAALAVILTVRNDYWTFGQPDTWIAILFIAFAVRLAEPAQARAIGTALVIGLGIGAATMVKPVYAAMILLPLAAHFLLPRAERCRHVPTATLIGFAVAIGGVCLVFVAAGHGRDLFDSYIAFNLRSHVTRTWDDLERVVGSFVVTLLAPRFDFGQTIIVAAGVLGFVTLRRRDRHAAGVLAAGWLAALASVVAQGKGFPYHFAIVHAFTALLAAYAVCERIARLASTTERPSAGVPDRRHAMKAGILIGLAVCAMAPHGQRAIDWWSVRLGMMSAAEREQRLCESDYCPWRTRALGELIRRETAPDEAIFVWGFDSVIYLLAGRPAVSRFGFSYPLIGGPSEFRAAARAELMTTLERSPPKLVVVQEDDPIRLLHARPSVDHVREFPEFEAFLARRYEPAHDLGRVIVHRRRD